MWALRVSVCFGVCTPLSPQALATAVAQLVVAEAGGVPGGAPGGSWSPRGCGVACLVRDSVRRSYFIRMYNLAVSGGPGGSGGIQGDLERLGAPTSSACTAWW